MNFELKTIRTLYHKFYQLEGNISLQHVGGDW